MQPGYFWGAHDARHSVYFLYEFDRAIRDGVWYPRWAPDFAFGYGYPFFNIYGPLSSYLGEAFHLAGLDIVTAVKVVFGLSAILSGLAMYLFVRQLFGRPAGLLAALIYVYIPYHLFDLYVRAALAESVGFVFVPLVLWGFFEVVTRPRLTAIGWAALAYAGLMFTSNLLALIFTPILGAYVLYLLFVPSPITPENDQQPDLSPPPPSPHSAPYTLIHGLRSAIRRLFTAALPPAATLALGLGLSAIFWLPAFLEYRFVRVDQWVGGRFAFGDDFVEFFQLFSPRWGFGASIPGPDDQAGFQIGLAAVILFILSFLVAPRLANPSNRRTLYFYQGMTLVTIFLTIPISSPVWTYLPLSSFAQFPWRLLVVIAPLISIAAGAVLIDLADHRAIPLALVSLACLVLLSSYPYLQAEVREPKPTEGPVSQAALFRFQQSSDEMTGQTAWVREIPNWSTLAEQVAAGGEITTKVNYTALPADDSVGVYSMAMDSVHELLWVGTEQEGRAITFLIPYYPGWQAYLYQDLGPHDGNLDEKAGPVTRIGPLVDQPAIRVTPREGWMVVPIPSGSHFLEIRFEDTPVRVVGRWVSIGSFLFVLLLGGLNFRRKSEK